MDRPRLVASPGTCNTTAPQWDAHLSGTSRHYRRARHTDCRCAVEGFVDQRPRTYCWESAVLYDSKDWDRCRYEGLCQASQHSPRDYWGSSCSIPSSLKAVWAYFNVHRIVNDAMLVPGCSENHGKQESYLCCDPDSTRTVDEAHGWKI